MSTFPRSLVAVAGAALLLFAACGDDDPSVSAAFAMPDDGAAIAGGVPFELTADGITIEEAGEVHDDSGHFHVLADAGCLDPGTAIPKDADHVHLGKGQSDGVIYLEPGEHELCVQVGDGAHSALDVTKTLSVEVGVTSQDEWCAVIDEADELLSSGEDIEEDFPALQLVQENARRLLTQLSDGIEFVDADARADVTASIDHVLEFIQVIQDSKDMDAAVAGLQPFWDEGEERTEPGQPWILETCNVDIGG